MKVILKTRNDVIERRKWRGRGRTLERLKTGGLADAGRLSGRLEEAEALAGDGLDLVGELAGQFLAQVA